MEIILARNFTADESTFRKDARQFASNKVCDALPMLGGVGEESCFRTLGYFSLEQGEKTAVSGNLRVIEGFKLGSLGAD